MNTRQEENYGICFRPRALTRMTPADKMSLQSLFPGYYRPSENDLAKMWEDGIFVFDTNVLLNLYRYSQSTRDKLSKTLGPRPELVEEMYLKAQVWPPKTAYLGQGVQPFSAVRHQKLVPWMRNKLTHKRKHAITGGSIDATTELGRILSDYKKPPALAASGTRSLVTGACG